MNIQHILTVKDARGAGIIRYILHFSSFHHTFIICKSKKNTVLCSL